MIKPKSTGYICILMLGVALMAYHVEADERKAVYVGSETCQGCHDAQYANFSANSKKAQSYEHIRKMQKKLEPTEMQGCFKCHTTGFEEPGGFRSAEETPGMKNPGCEVCHGPGSLHAESGDPVDLTVKVSLQTCAKCHNNDRVATFRFKPMLFAGAH